MSAEHESIMKTTLYQALYSTSEWCRITEALEVLGVPLVLDNSHALMAVYTVPISPDETLALLEMLGIDT